MRILVTGGTGFTGKALALRLVKEGHQVVALDYKEGVQTDELRKAGVEVVIGTVTDRAVVRKAMAGVEIVHHLAAAFREMNVPQSHYDDVNVGGTRVVLEEAVRAGVRRLIYCSTCGVHGNVANPPADEDAPIQPADYYQRTKYLAEPIVADYAAKGMIEAVTLRPAAIYGPGDLERFAMIYRQVSKGWFPIFGDGKAFYHPNYVENLVDAFVLAQGADKDAVNGKAFLIADEEYVTTEDLVRRVAKVLDIDLKILRFPLLPMQILGHVCELLCRPFGIAPPIFPRRVDWYRQNRAFSTRKAETFLGYKPRVSIDEGLRRTGAWYREHGIISPARSRRNAGTATQAPSMIRH